MYSKIIGILCLFILSSCTFAGDPDTYGKNGFLMGIWHGMVSLGALIVSMVNNDIHIYSYSNVGWLYNFSFLICAILFSWNIGIIATCISIMFLFY